MMFVYLPILLLLLLVCDRIIGKCNFITFKPLKTVYVVFTLKQLVFLIPDISFSILKHKKNLKRLGHLIVNE